jgi:hypothetical protein
LTLAILVRGGSAGTGGDFAEVEAERSQPNGPRRGGRAGAGGTGGVKTPEEAEDADPRFLGGSSGGPDVAGIYDPGWRALVASASASNRCRVSSSDTSLKVSAPSADSRC